jgi:hypothetical protein
LPYILRTCRPSSTPPYLADAQRLFTEAERTDIVDLVAADPRGGVVIPGSGGVRKLRVGFGGRGKRGGARIIFLFGGEDVPVFLLAAFAKNEKADLSAAERTTLGKQVAKMLAEYRRRK